MRHKKSRERVTIIASDLAALLYKFKSPIQRGQLLKAIATVMLHTYPCNYDALMTNLDSNPNKKQRKEWEITKCRSTSRHIARVQKISPEKQNNIGKSLWESLAHSLLRLSQNGLDTGGQGHHVSWNLSLEWLQCPRGGESRCYDATSHLKSFLGFRHGLCGEGHEEKAMSSVSPIMSSWSCHVVVCNFDTRKLWEEMSYQKPCHGFHSELLSTLQRKNFVLKMAVSTRRWLAVLCVTTRIAVTSALQHAGTREKLPSFIMCFGQQRNQIGLRVTPAISLMDRSRSFSHMRLAPHTPPVTTRSSGESGAARISMSSDISTKVKISYF